MKTCACDQCQTPIVPSSAIAYEDGYCNYCHYNCFPVYRAGTIQSRMVLTPMARAQLHNRLIPVADPSAGTRLGEALQQVFMEHGVPFLKQEAGKLLRKLITRR